MLRGGGTTIALALTGTLLAVAPAGSAEAVDPTCPFTTGDVRTFTGQDSNSWADPDNWSPPGIPNDNAPFTSPTPETNTTYVCIGTGKSVYMDKTELFAASSGWVELQGYWLGKDATLTAGDGIALMNNDHTTASVTEHGSLLSVTSAYLGGQGPLLVKGDLSVAASADTGASTLTSTHDSQPIETQTQEGHLVIDTAGRLLLPSLGVQMRRGYDIDVFGQLVMTTSGFLAPHFDTSVTVELGATYEFGGWGGFYEGPTDSGPDVIPSLVNRGTLLKTGPSTALIAPNEDGYVEQGNADIVVTGGTQAFAGGTTYTADVSAGQGFSTAECTLHGANQPCSEELSPSRDLQSVAFAVPTGDVSGASVEVLELSEPATNVDVKGVGNVLVAHADPGQLQATPDNPAILTFRTGAQEMGTPHQADFGIVHQAVAGGPTELLPDCLPSGVPPSGTGCVDRRGLPGSSHTDDKNVYLVVRTTATSRYVCHKADVTAPSIGAKAPKVALKKPIAVTANVDEGSSLSVSGSVKAKGLTLPLRTVSVVATANQATTVVLKLKSKHKKKLDRVHATKGKAVLTITATDVSGHVGLYRLTVKLT